eukprot:TRINITY_DN8572_c0_g1_i1.p1 TRINITY_DN8572_c0_g1~~TRINITY_DN8572_c0_g1_i1.p1  ORF type:complete len:291 (-),score=49.53 TRINITY_DN8572_c0_g1_i1:147-1019(-)
MLGLLPRRISRWLLLVVIVVFYLAWWGLSGDHVGGPILQPIQQQPGPVESILNENESPILELDYVVEKTYPHNSESFTQGLEFSGDFLYEGTGLRGESKLIKRDWETGEIVKQVLLDSEYFGEGITIFGEKVYQLTWKNKVGFIYNKETLEKIGEWTYDYEGWGLTHDDKHLIVSDGTNQIRFLHPETFQVVRVIKVTRQMVDVIHINELEYINGFIWANIWYMKWVEVIDPLTGKVVARLDLRELNYPPGEGEDVLNGIAYYKRNARVYVTGKKWHKMFQLKVDTKIPH